MANYIKYGIVVFVVTAIYLVGYKHAQTEGERAIEALKLEHASAVIRAQEKEKAKYEKDVASLVAALDELRDQHDGRLHELEQFRNAGRDLQTCLSERGSLAELAVRGESLLKRSVQYLESQVRQK